jgi:hypothetical protein
MPYTLPPAVHLKPASKWTSALENADRQGRQPKFAAVGGAACDELPGSAKPRRARQGEVSERQRCCGRPGIRRKPEVKRWSDEKNLETLITPPASSGGGRDRHRIADRTDAVAQHLKINAEIGMAEMLHDRFRQIGIACGVLGVDVDGGTAPRP